jgi:glycosyltransferase involved in cell wall biosynthesis
MRVVFINSIFPNPAEPLKGNFILRSISKYPKSIAVEVIAPVPFGLSMWRKKKVLVPFARTIHVGDRKIRIWHPRFVLLPKNLLQSLVPYFEYLCMLPLLALLNKINKVDLLHANFCLPDGVATYYLAQKLGIPYVITEHRGALGDLLAKPRLRHLMFPAYANARKVITVSERIKDALYAANYFKQNVCVIPNGIELNAYPLSAASESVRKLIFVGNLIEEKGVQILLEALALLKDPGLSLTIVGDGKHRPRLEQMTSELRLEDQVSFAGEIPFTEIPELIRDHDALVHPSFQESFGIVVLEALACGKPVLATINGGSEFILKEGQGILVPPKDAAALAEGLRRLQMGSYDPEVLREYVQHHYSLDNVIADTIWEYPSSDNEYCICHLSSVHIRSDVRIFYKQCLSLVEEGYKVHLVVSDGKRHERKQGVIIHDTGAPESRKQRFFSAPFKVLRRAVFINADIYQIHDPELLPIAFLLKLITRKPVIYDIHECYPEMFLHKEYLSPFAGKLMSVLIKAMERMAVNVLDQAIAATEHIAEQFKGVPVVHNYPILAEWAQISADPARYGSRNICYVGNITRERGIEQIVKAIEHVDCTLHLAGAYEPMEFRDCLRQLPGFSKVVEYGYVDRKQAAEIFAISALGVVLFDRSPNHLYSLSTKMFEYMAAGLPIMVSDLPTNVKLLDSTDAGVYLDSTRVELISASLQKLLEQPEQLAAWGANGKKLMWDTLSWESEKAVYLGLCRKLLKVEKS